MAQHAVEQVGPQNHDLSRTGRMFFYGGAIFGPAATKWFSLLQKHVRIPTRPNVEILAKVTADQFLFAPTNLFVFLSTMAVLEGSDPREKLKSTYGNALSKNFMVWPWVQMFNFRFVPLEHRVLVVNGVALGWNSYLSYLNSRGPGPEIEEVEPEFT